MRYLWLVVGLAGCPWVGGGKYDERVRDLDGDGGIAVRFGGSDCLDENPEIADCDDDDDGHLTVLAGGDDCDDANGSVHPDAVERCNGIDDDCDGAIDNDDPGVVGENRYFVDADGDGDGDPDEQRACQEQQGGEPVFVTNDDDCNDNDAFVSTDATEVCDGIDNNCDGVVDDVGTWFVDADGDGFGNPDLQAVGSCDLSNTTGLSAVGTDCDDTDGDVFPGAPEQRYDGLDANCNGGLDDWDGDFDGYVPSEHWAAAEAANLLLPPAQQWAISNGDCDDDDPRRFEGNPEVCDGVDNDCDELVDVQDLDGVGPTEELALRGEVQAVFLDADGDGHFGTPLTLCPAQVDPQLHSLTEDDCYDGGEAGPFGAVDPTLVHDDAHEVCDGVDNDCDGRADWAFTTFGGATAHYVDGDGDGYGADEVFACGVLPAAGIVAEGDDCNDGDASTFPDAPEVCGDIVRQDCSTLSVWDCDGDGQEGDYQGNGSGEDCNDQQAAIYRTDEAAFEVCDGVDNDCDGLVDSADPDNLDTSTLVLWYPDLDGDGWGVDQGDPIQQCDPPSELAAPRAGDCDDTDPDLHPETPWFLDQDGDGFGPTASSTIATCDPPDAGPWVRDGGDCNDLDPIYNPLTVWYPDLDGDFVGNPAAAEQFCNPPAGTSFVLASAGEDCNDANPDVLGTTTWYADADNDGWGDDDVSTQSCAQPVIGQVQFVVAPGDCDDDETAVNPLQTESCNAVDDDCDGLIDDLDPNLVATPGGPRGYLDEDGDGTGRDDVVKDFCVALPPGWAPIAGDCQDDDAHVYPGAIEICGNGIDDDCVEGEQIPVWYVDDDGDGFGTGAASAPSCDPPTGFSATAPGDCDDTQPLSYPGAPERDACDTIDDNCDGQPEPRLTWYFDQDLDGYGDDAEQVTTCVPPTAPPAGSSGGDWVLSGGDCDDADASVTFGRLWYVDADGDGLGNDTAAFFDCPVYDGNGNQLPSFLLQDLDGDGVYDSGDIAASIFAGDCDDANALVGQARGYRVDADGDGWGSSNVAEVVACPTASGNPPAGLVTRSGDCVDVPSDDPDTLVPPELINPESLEVLDDLADNDCDGFTDQIGGGIAWFEDADGDGLGGSALASYEPGAVTNGSDCDDGDATIANGLFLYTDGDDDGFGGGSPVFNAGVCTVPSGSTLFGGDCDDTTDTVRPGAVEVCDGDDDDCDGVVDDGVSTFGYADADDDGHGDADAPGFYCPAELFVLDLDNGADCNDDEETISPSAVELCDGIDNNCVDGIGDEAVPLWYLDADGDLVGSNTSVVQSCVEPGPDWLATNGDCNDSDPSVLPGATESCNGIDDDCDEAIDEDFSLFTAYRDEDGDGAVEPGSMVQVCVVPVGFTTTLGPDDCDDGNASVSPLLPELCGDGLDNDCAAGIDDAALRFADADQDGYGWPFTFELAACDSSVHADVSGDCDDTLASRNPGAADDTCNGVDEDCDNVADEDATGGPSHYRDLDGDGFGDPSVTVQACTAPAGYVSDHTDCDDLRATAFPGAHELCNGLDDDCDSSPEPTNTWYADLDRDGFRSDTDTLVVCATEPAPAFYDLDATAGIDCDDDEEDINPAADETCGDGIDNDCDATIDEEGQRYPDVDEDGYGTGSTELASCSSDAHADVAGDCDDALASRNPGAADDTCNGVDEDCDDLVDEDATGGAMHYRDLDGDGFGDPAVAVQACFAPVGYVSDHTDCDDLRATAFPGAHELCNGLDDDCDSSPEPTNTWYADLDRDGFRSDTDLRVVCATEPAPAFYDLDGTAGVDCDDTDEDVSPAGEEVCGDGIDNDCDTATDEDGQRYPDLDRDGYGTGSTELASCSSLDHSDAAGDCNDDAFGINPGVASDACNGVDDDCDGASDEDATFLTYYVDGDGDGFGVTALSFASCDGGTGGSTTPGDCDDGRASVNPTAHEVCNGLDDDCIDGLPGTEVDGDGDGFLACEESNDSDPNDTPNAPTWYRDADGDGFGDDATTQVSLSNPGAGWTQVSGDCNDADASMSPGIPIEFCDGKDNNCDGAEYWGDGHFIGFDVSNPITGSVADGDASIAWLHDHDGDGHFSLDRAVSTCHEDSVTTAEVRIDVTVVPLQRLNFDDLVVLLAADDCINGNTGSFYAYDRDGDAVPALVGADDVRVVCDGSSPAAPWYPLTLTTELDCAPEDFARAELVATGEYADADGDGVVSLVPVPGACVAVGSSQATPGTDCDDDDGGSTDVLPGVVDVTTSAELASYLGSCSVASFKLDAGFTSLGTLTLPDGSDITIEGNGSSDCDDLITSGCVSGSIVVGTGSSLTLRGLGLEGSIDDSTEAFLTLEDVSLVGGLNKNGGNLYVGNTRFFPTADVTEVVTLSGALALFEDVSFFGTGQDGLVITGGETELISAYFTDLAKALFLVDAVLYGESVVIEDSTAPLEVSGPGADVYFYGFETHDSGTSQVLNGFAACQQCTFRIPTGPVFRVQNAVTNNPTLDMSEVVVEGDTNTSGAVFEVNGGNATFSLFGLQFDVTPLRPIVAADGGRAHVYDTYLNDYPHESESPFQVKDGGYLLLNNSGGDSTSVVSSAGEPVALVQVTANGEAELVDGFSRHFSLARVDDGVLRANGYEIREIRSKNAGLFTLATVELERVRLHMDGAPEQYFTLDQADLTAIRTMFHAEETTAEWPQTPFTVLDGSVVFLQSTVYGPGKFVDGDSPLFYFEGGTGFMRDTLVDAGSGCLYINGFGQGEGPPLLTMQDSWIDFPFDRGVEMFGETPCFDAPTFPLGTIGEEFFTGEPTYDTDTVQTNPLIRYTYGETIP